MTDDSGYLPGSDTSQEASGRAIVLDYVLSGLEETTCARSACYLLLRGTSCFTAADTALACHSVGTDNAEGS